MQGLSFFKVSVWRERGSFILEIAGDPFLFFFSGYLSWVLLLPVWINLGWTKGWCFPSLHFWDGAGIGTCCARRKEKKSSLSRAEDVFRFQWVFTQYGKVAPLYPEESRFSAFRPRHSIPIRCTSLKLLKWESWTVTGKKKSPVC